MGGFSKWVDYLAATILLFGCGELFLFLNKSTASYAVLHFSLFQICQSVILLILAILTISREHAPEQQHHEFDQKENVDTMNATMMLIVVAILVVGFYMISMRLPKEGVSQPAPIHLILCIVVFILYVTVEKWWSMQLDTRSDAASICTMLALDRIALGILFLELGMQLTGIADVARYADYAVLALWTFFALSVLASVAIKVLRHGDEPQFTLYLPLPFYRRSNSNGGVLHWLERNTGISMRSLWSLQFLRSTLPACGLGVVLLLWCSTCIIQVEPHQQGACYRFGRLSPTDILQPGLHFKLPTPFEQVKLYDVSRVQSLIVGYEGDADNRDNLWNRPHKGEEHKLLTGAGRELVAINLKINYRISDLYRYLTRYASAEQVLNAKGYALVMDETVATDINTIISEDRSLLAHKIEQKLIEYAGQSDLGLEVTGVFLASIHPPVEIADSYQSVVSAGIRKKASVLAAEGNALMAHSMAEADSRAAINGAHALQDKRISLAAAESFEYNASAEAYLLAPEVYRLNSYLDVFQRTMQGKTKYLLGPGVDPGSIYAGVGNTTLLRATQSPGNTAGDSAKGG